MNLKKTCILVAFLLLSDMSFAVSPTLRTNTVRAGSTTSTATTSRPQNTVTIGSLGGKTTVGRPIGNIIHTNIPATQDKKSLDSVYEEMQQIRDAVEEQLQTHRLEILDLQDQIAEKDEKISQLEASLEEYEEIKQSVKDMPATINEEIERRGFITAESVATNIEEAKQEAIATAKNDTTKAVQAATATVKTEVATERAAALAH